jgi:hypothetical protein
VLEPPPDRGATPSSCRPGPGDRRGSEDSEDASGIKPLGVAAILAHDPTHRPKKLKKSPAPFVHAATKAMRRALWEAYATFVAAYRDAAEKLRAGDPDPPFPARCFPPAMPFVGA